MDISGTIGISGDYRNRGTPVNWETLLLAEVVFLDKTNDNTRPLLYQLKDTSISNNPPLVIKANAVSFSREAFALLGEVVTIDKKKKQVFLTNNNTVSYQYIVIVSGSKPILTFQDPEFGPGLQTLIDALRVSAKMPTSFEVTKLSALNPPHKSSYATNPKEESPEIEKVVHPSIASAGAKAVASDLKSHNKRLYEVQL